MSAMKDLATPLYEHTCPACQFLGTVLVPIQDYEPADMYKCDRYFTLRFSNDPSDERSGTQESLAFWFRTYKEQSC